MDASIYVVRQLAEAHLRELREASRQAALCQSLRRERRRLRVALGEALIRIGRWLGSRPEGEPDRPDQRPQYPGAHTHPYPFHHQWPGAQNGRGAITTGGATITGGTTSGIGARMIPE